MSVLPPDVISDWSQDFCPWAGIATRTKYEETMDFVQSQDFCPWAGIANRDRNHTKNRRGRPRISAPGQALRNDNVYASQDFCPWAGIATTLEALAKAVPGFLPLGRHCDFSGGDESVQHSVLTVPGFLPLGRHCDAVCGILPRGSRPRISAPGQALRQVPGFLPLGRHCDRPIRSAANPSQDFCPWAGITTPTRSRQLPLGSPVPGFLPLGRHCDMSQDFRPWAGIATM